MEIINPENLLLRIVPILEELGISYYVTGGLAISAWGAPRSTLDIDIVIKIIEPKVTLLARALKKISEFGYIDEDAAKDAIRFKGEFNFIDPESGYKVDFWLTKNDPLAAMQNERKIAYEIENQKIYFISPEDLILNKLQWYEQSQSSRHLEDIRSVIKSCGKKLDKKYLKQWAGKLDVLGMLTELLKK